MEGMTFSREEKERMVAKVQAYFEREMDQSLGGFEAEFLIDFFASEMGAFFYNRGLYDAEAAITAKLADISDQLLELERPL
ncbi:DUF2164 domain-containing protein [Thalassolituus marinus]|uniref:DUF2164 domain-containing protein n=1 Tax=Thalassolituus marinus TaxID=671053 RepID=A0ABS7ZR62_9GAMM|nr:DUF2164 domain-containing protein [Thalassolituus marinus]MCA6062971.1 DUF2164 domain-containing protein [Thalassolituus marinus]